VYNICRYKKPALDNIICVHYIGCIINNHLLRGVVTLHNVEIIIMARIRWDFKLIKQTTLMNFESFNIS